MDLIALDAPAKVNLGLRVEATESADTRCWGLLPEKIQVIRLELPAGQHKLALAPVGTMGAAIAHETTVTIDDGRNTYAVVSFPTARLAGGIVCSRR